MKAARFKIPLLVSVLLTPPFLLLALISTGAGHGDYFWAKILFPFTILSALVFDSITAPFIALAVVQFPIYGFVVGKANMRGKLVKYLVVISILHVLAALTCFRFAASF